MTLNSSKLQPALVAVAVRAVPQSAASIGDGAQMELGLAVVVAPRRRVSKPYRRRASRKDPLGKRKDLLGKISYKPKSAGAPPLDGRPNDPRSLPSFFLEKPDGVCNVSIYRHADFRSLRPSGIWFEVYEWQESA